MQQFSKAVNTVAHDLGLDPKLVNGAYIGFWKAVRTHIQGLPLKDNIGPEDFKKLKTHYNIPSLGKLNCTYERMVNVKKSKNYENYITEEDNSSCNESSDNC